MLAVSLIELSAVLEPDATARQVAERCRTVSDWAKATGHTATALGFMQAAALADPEDSEAALLTGRLARRRAEAARSECWFWEAVARSRRSRDGRSRALAFLGMGNLQLHRGNLPAAERCHLRGVRIARAAGCAEIEAFGFHDLAVTSGELGKTEAAERYALEAARGYGAGHARLPNLANDVAVLWTERGDFARARIVFEALLPHIREPHERLLTRAAVAHTAAAMGDGDTFRLLWEELWSELDRMEAGHPSSSDSADARALLALAQGATAVGDVERGRLAGERAVRTATTRGLWKVQHVAEALLDALPERAVPAPAAQPAARPQAEVLLAELVTGLEGAIGA